MASFKTGAILGVKPLYLPDDAEVCGSPVEISWADAGAGIAANDIIQLAELPPSVELVDYTIVTDDIDGNGTPTVAFSFGVLNAAGTDLAEVYATGITAAQAGGIYRAAGVAQLASDRQSTRRLGLKATGATATAALTGKRAVVLLQLRG